MKLPYHNESPGRISRRGFVLSVVALHRDRTEELYFITLVLISTACSPSQATWLMTEPRSKQFRII